MVRLACLLGLLWSGIAQADCRLALVLALDVSASVDATEYNLQRLGTSAALDSSDVRHAILEGAPGHVALAVYEWSGHYQQKLHLDWTALRTHGDIDRAVLALGQMTRSHDEFPTSVGQALAYGASVLERGPDCDRRVIDMSGDGVNNYGFRPGNAYRHFPFQDVVVNGLVILGDDPDVLGFYHGEVLHGPGAFLEIANGFADFQNAMTRKLRREISDIILGTGPTARPRPRG
nr:DUF1194 domain-containing protein [Pseudohalocynthiibacter aestuariivivens]